MLSLAWQKNLIEVNGKRFVECMVTCFLVGSQIVAQHRNTTWSTTPTVSYTTYIPARLILIELPNHQFILFTAQTALWTHYGINGLKGPKIHKIAAAGFFD
jgi:hypothetical protein